jgi:UDP-N-acetylglucosamine 1-carboxyvinyltransferase
MPTKKGDLTKIGEFIKNLREERNLTQAELATGLGSSQSAIARMEKGEQNLTLSQLAKMSELLGHQILSLSKTVDYEITGGRELSGSVRTNYSKNGAICMLCASLLNKGKTVLHGIPHIEEVSRYIEIMESLGVSVRWIEDPIRKGHATTLEIIPPKELTFDKMNLESARKTRSFTFVGALIHWKKSFSFPHSGGCKMGERTIAAHKYGLAKFGTSIKTLEDTYEISSKKLKPAEFVLYESSDTGAIAMLIAAAGIPGTSIIRFAPPNYQVQDVCFLIEKMGVKIDGIGTTTLTVHGRENIHETVEHWNSEDPIETMFFLSAGIVTKSTLTVTHCPIEFIELEIEKLRQMGVPFKMSKSYHSMNGRTLLRDITVMPAKKLVAPLEKLHAQPFPGMQNDNLPFFVPIATQAKGTTLIHDWTWENRAIYFTELNKLGANVRLVDPHRAFIEGPTKLKGAQIVCPPALRPSAVILIAMLAAEGTSMLRNVYSITRGYEEIAERLNAIGAKIRVVKGV